MVADVCAVSNSFLYIGCTGVEQNAFLNTSDSSSSIAAKHLEKIKITCNAAYQAFNQSQYLTNII